MAILPMVKTILGSLLHKEATQAYPYKPMPKAPLVRGQISIDIDVCIFCGICSKKCPTHALAVDRNARSWEIKRFECIICGEYTSVCPKKCLHMLQELTLSSSEKISDKFTGAAPAAKPAAPDPAGSTPGAAPGA
ncbi:MAG: 4Fe-4S binding protein [Treponema sp.]|nr:4Fe-4S binding protein [Treponema sp.]